MAEILKKQNITPYRLAKLIGCPAPTVYAWVENKTNPYKYTADILKILGIKLEDLMEVVEYD